MPFRVNPTISAKVKRSGLIPLLFACVKILSGPKKTSEVLRGRSLRSGSGQQAVESHHPTMACNLRPLPHLALQAL